MRLLSIFLFFILANHNLLAAYVYSSTGFTYPGCQRNAWGMLDCGQTMPVDCINCGTNSAWNMPWYIQQEQPQYYDPFTYNPWYQQYGVNRWNNWNTPGLVNNWHSTPGGGGMAAMKPNVYLSGKAGTNFKIDIEFLNKSNLLIASPSLQKGWKGYIGEDKKLYVDGVGYSYLYYDYKSYKHTAQFTNGFCGSKEDIIQQMGIMLNQAGFRQKEIIDFYEHWPHKLHDAKEYCVFPQDNSNIQPQVKLSIEPDNSHLVQLNFIIVLKKGLYQKIQALPYKLNPRYVSKRSEDIFELREWGVIFLTDN